MCAQAGCQLCVYVHACVRVCVCVLQMEGKGGDPI